MVAEISSTAVKKHLGIVFVFPPRAPTRQDGGDFVDTPRRSPRTNHRRMMGHGIAAEGESANANIFCLAGGC